MKKILSVNLGKNFGIWGNFCVTLCKRARNLSNFYDEKSCIDSTFVLQLQVLNYYYNCSYVFYL